jgi:hypothetical protein
VGGDDFNPVNDRLRVTGSNNENLRVDPDTALVFTDGTINPPGAQVAGVAYSNNLPGATTTMLYAYGFAADDVFTINPPNNGTLVPLGEPGIVSANSVDIGLDVAPSGLAYAVHNVGGTESLYAVNLQNGAHTAPAATPTLLSGLTASTANLVRVATTTQSVSEQDDSVSVTVVRDNPRGPLNLAWGTAGGSATAGADYTASNGGLSMLDGEVSKTVTIPLLSDAADEPDETFFVTFFRNGNGDGTVVLPIATITLKDDDVPEPTPPDRDSDGVPDATDNCANVANADQADGNGNGVGKACDLREVSTPAPVTTTVTTTTPAPPPPAAAPVTPRPVAKPKVSKRAAALKKCKKIKNRKKRAACTKKAKKIRSTA